MASTSVRDDQSLIWQAKCNDGGFAIPIRQITSTQEIDYDLTNQEESDIDNTFHASETQVPAPRYLDYKSDSAVFDDDNYEESMNQIESQIIPDEHFLKLRDDDVVLRRNHVIGNENVTYNSRTERDNTVDMSKDSANQGQVSKAEKLIRRKSCPIPSDYDRSAKLSLPKQYSIGDPETIITEEEKEAEKAARNANLQEITSMIRKMSRPTLHKDADYSSFDDDYSSTGTWLPGTDQVPSVNPLEKNSHGECEFDKYSEITMQTRKATKPKVSDLNLKPEKVRSRSVAHIQSPAVPALSPGRERFSFTRSLSSNSSSSSESFYPYPPSNVTDPCFRCGRQVYSLDKVGPIRRELFHKQCFRCVECNSVLNLKNYCQNPNDKTDKQIYCKNHQPSQDSAHISLDDRNINIVMNNPKLDIVNTNIRGSEEDKAKSRNQRTFRIRGVASTPKLDIVCGQQYGFSYTNGNTMHDAGLLSPRSQSIITSPREMRVDEIEPRRVWTRSSMNAAILDLSAPMSGRNTHHFYDYGSKAFNHL